MARFLRNNVIGLLALVVALGGTAVAAKNGSKRKAPKNSVVSKSIKNRQVKKRDLARGAVNGSRVKDGSLTGIELVPDALGGDQIDESLLGKVRSAVSADTAATATSADTAAHADSAARADTAGTADDASALGGRGPDSYRRYGGTVPSGTTLTGIWGCNHTSSSFACRAFVSLPLPAPEPLGDATVNFGPSIWATDDDPQCTGSEADPTAPPGKVCLYLSYRQFNQQNGLEGGVPIDGSTPGFTSRGFVVDVDVEQNGASGGVWAYTAP